MIKALLKKGLVFLRYLVIIILMGIVIVGTGFIIPAQMIIISGICKYLDYLYRGL